LTYPAPFVEHQARVLGHKDQMNMHAEYTMPEAPNLVVISHLPEQLFQSTVEIESPPHRTRSQ